MEMDLFKFKVLLVLTLSVCLSFRVIAEPIKKWQTPYAAMNSSIAADPDNVLTQLQSIDLSGRSTASISAQHHITLSRVYYALSYPQKALLSARQSLKFIDPKLQPWLFQYARLTEALALELSGKPRAGLINTNAAIVWGELNKDLDMVIYGLYVRGNILNTLLDFHGALRDLQRAYDLAPVSGAEINKGDIAGMLGLVYEYRSEDQLAVPFFTESANYHRESKNWIELSIALYGLGRANKNIGNIALGRDQLQESARLAHTVNDQQGVAYALKELGGLELSLGNLSQAKHFFTKALKTFQQSENKYMLLDTTLSLAKVAIANQAIDAAERYIHQAYGLVEAESMRVQKLHVDEQYARVLSLKGQHQAAFDLLYNTIPAKQKLFSQQSTQQLHSLRSQYEVIAKERENKLLEAENLIQRIDLKDSQTRYWQLMLLLTSSLLVTGLLILLVYRTKQNRKALEALANFDSLTKLGNRRYTLEQLQTQLDLANRHSFSVVIAIADLDHFKRINDTHGHAAGDKVLRAFGQLCQTTFRQSDIVGRIGGEEFLIAFPHTSIEDASEILLKLLHKVRELGGNLDIDGLTLSVSCGLVSHQPKYPLAELLVQADQALYRAKKQGRDRVEVFDND